MLCSCYSPSDSYYCSPDSIETVGTYEEGAEIEDASVILHASIPLITAKPEKTTVTIPIILEYIGDEPNYSFNTKHLELLSDKLYKPLSKKDIVLEKGKPAQGELEYEVKEISNGCMLVYSENEGECSGKKEAVILFSV